MENDSSSALDSWASLLIRSREGDALAFEELVRASERRVLSIAYQITGNMEEARDVAQESFLLVYRSRDRFEAGRPFEAWLYRIVVNQARKAVARSRRRRTEPLGEAHTETIADATGREPLEAAVQGQVSERIFRLMGELSPKLRAVLVLRDLQGMETDEIARILGCAEGTVRRHSAEARLRLKRLLEKASVAPFQKK